MSSPQLAGEHLLVEGDEGGKDGSPPALGGRMFHTPARFSTSSARLEPQTNVDDPLGADA